MSIQSPTKESQEAMQAKTQAVPPMNVGSGLPEGGTVGQVLTKTATGAEWDDVPEELPEGGTTGQVLTKTASGTAWGNIPEELPTGGTEGQVLTLEVPEGETDPVPTWADPEGGSFEYTDQYGAPSDIPQIKFGYQVSSGDLTLGERYFVTLGPQYTPDRSEEEPTPGSIQNGKALYDYIVEKSTSSPGVVVNVNFATFELYYYDSSEDEYLEFTQFQGGSWTAKAWKSSSNVILNIEGFFRNSGCDAFIHLHLQLKTTDGLTWSNYSSASSTVTPILGTFLAD